MATSKASIIIGEAVRIEPPALTPVSIDEVKDQSRIDMDEMIILRLINAATNYVEDYTDLGLITQTWQQSFSAFPTVVTLSKRPLQAVTSIDDLTVGSPFTTIDPFGYAVSGIGLLRRSGTVRLVTGASWPTLTGEFGEAARVTYRVGFGDTSESVPEMIRHAILLLIGMWYDNRETPDLGPVHALLTDWRQLGVA